jgi:hypothetical protein
MGMGFLTYGLHLSLPWLPGLELDRGVKGVGNSGFIVMSLVGEPPLNRSSVTGHGHGYY